ncbi:hypothetical protein A0J61_01907 [Choanephora cucurbitarum]|uniref:Invertebrate defensins family profile domain-containing protein n=1 Tax=Choanephora cucurbitarum TaxID=101091 RepID=A0A1C7NLT4_9FUNG|nr:hypothetical protein A0J61_01907 [Choanephora cucurbitarum]
MKFALYLTIFVAALVMMASAAPSNKRCKTITDAHENAVCKKYCGNSGYLLGECGSSGICLCKNKKYTTKKSKQ